MSKRTDQDAPAAILHRPWSAGDASSIDTVGGRSKTPAALYCELSRLGFGAAEAGNLTAFLMGIPPVRSGWAPHEIGRLLFIRHVFKRGWTDARTSS